MHGYLPLTNAVRYTGTGLCDGPVPRTDESHQVRMCLIVRSGAAITSTPTMSKNKEVKTWKKKLIFCHENRAYCVHVPLLQTKRHINPLKIAIYPNYTQKFNLYLRKNKVNSILGWRILDRY
jgi:hypothetical protein